MLQGDRLTSEQRLIGRILAADWSTGARRDWPLPWFDGIDWNTVATLTWQHKLRPMTLAALQEAGWPGVPGAIREAIERDARKCGLKSIRQLTSLRAVAAAAMAAQLRLIALKGLPLSMLLYGDPFIREAFDLDLMTSPADYAQTKKILEECGFRPVVPEEWTTPRQSAILASFRHEEQYVHGDGTMIELHRAVDRNTWRLSIDFEDLWRDRQLVQVGQDRIAIPGDRHLILFLGIHAARHAWARWKWVGDLVVLYRKSGPEALVRQRDLAKAEGLMQYFDSALLLANTITGWPLPAELADAVRMNKRAACLSQRALKFSTQAVTPNEAARHGYKSRHLIFVLQLNRDPRYLAHEFLSMVHRRRDWYALRLPDYLIPAYYLIRPCSYIWRRVPQLIRFIGGRNRR
ncbi:MAG TPA: nucleotidyltransferase family protein [Bryobacteraceae bacterium]|jgi:hypothetical protein